MWVPLDVPGSKGSKVSKRRMDETLAGISGRARFLIDECLGGDVVRLLAALGLNARFAPDEGVRTDEEVYALGWNQRRVILTHDRDFLDDRRFPFHRNPGVVVMPGANGNGDGLLNAIDDVGFLFGEYCHLFPNAKMEISDEGFWTVRRLVAPIARLGGFG